jgi:hypothetical protein
MLGFYHLHLDDKMDPTEALFVLDNASLGAEMTRAIHLRGEQYIPL